MDVKTRTVVASAFALSCLLLAQCAVAQTDLSAKDPKDLYNRGAVHGKIMDGAGKPLPGATVAIVARTGKVMTWTKTDQNGKYQLAANPKTALDIQPLRNRGLLKMCLNAAGEVVMAPVKVVANMVANPGLTVATAGVSIASGTPLPLETQAIVQSLPNHETVVQTQLATQGAVAAQALGIGIKPTVFDLSLEGRASLLVEAPGFKKASVIAPAYWVEPPCEQDGNSMGLQAWVDSVKLAPSDAKGDASVVSEAFMLTDATVSPTLVPAGGEMHISVKLNGPLDDAHPVRVFAREYPRNQVVELTPRKDPLGKDTTIFEGSMFLDRVCSLGDATVCIAALRGEPVGVKLDVKNTEAVIRYVKRMESMEAGKQYGYDPMVMASQNRADVKITVLSPKAETPPAEIKPTVTVQKP